MENNDPVPIPGAAQPVIEQSYNTPAPVVAQPAVVATPIPVPATPQFQSGGKPGANFFDGITLMDVIVGAFVIGGLSLAILYYRDRIKHAKIEYPELRSDIDALKKKVEDMETPKIQTEF